MTQSCGCGMAVERRMVAIAGGFVAYAFVFCVSFIAAETLSRRAFPHHIQFWNI